MLKFLFSLILLTACSGSIQSPEMPRPCGHVFTPEADLLLDTVIDTERWSEATGCPVTVGENGTRVEQVDEFYIDYEKDEVSYEPAKGLITLCGKYFREEDKILISRQVASDKICPVAGVVGVIAHEMGHVLAGIGGHVKDGVLAKYTAAQSDRLITESTLLKVCDWQICQEFNPETSWDSVKSSHPGLALRNLSETDVYYQTALQSLQIEELLLSTPSPMPLWLHLF